MFGYIIYSGRCIEMHLPYIAQAMESNKDEFTMILVSLELKQDKRSLKDFSVNV